VSLHLASAQSRDFEYVSRFLHRFERLNLVLLRKWDNLAPMPLILFRKRQNARTKKRDVNSARTLTANNEETCRINQVEINSDERGRCQSRRISKQNVECARAGQEITRLDLLCCHQATNDQRHKIIELKAFEWKIEISNGLVHRLNKLQRNQSRWQPEHPGTYLHETEFTPQTWYFHCYRGNDASIEMFNLTNEWEK